MNERRRRRHFQDQVEECEAVTRVLSDSREGVLRVYTTDGTKLVWMHFSDHFNFWGGAETKNDQLRAHRVPLFHAFLGRDRDQYYLVPDEELHSGRFDMPVQKKDGSTHWKLHISQGDPPNQVHLAQFSDLCGNF